MIAIFLALCAGSFVENVDIGNSTIALLVRLHNNERAQYCSSDITYSATLADSAKQKSKECDLSSSMTTYGENVFSASFSYVRVQTAVTAWSHERTSFACLDDYPPDSSNRNYMQMITNATKTFGCGASKCKITIGTYSQYMLWVVCFYDVSIYSIPVIVDKQYCNAYGECPQTTQLQTSQTTQLQTSQQTIPQTVQTSQTTQLKNTTKSSTISSTPSQTKSTQTTQTTQTTKTSQLPTETSQTQTIETSPLTSQLQTTQSTQLQTTQTTQLQTTQKPPSTIAPTITRPPDDKCVLLKKLCWEKCGRPLIFPFLEQCYTGWDGGILGCVSPPDCLCDVPAEYQSYGSSIMQCRMASCDNAFEGTNPGSLGWCKSCGYNCGKYQADCINNEHFCMNPGRCSRLNMCSDWRAENCIDINDYNCGRAANIETEVTQSPVNTYGSSLGWLIAFVVLIFVFGVVALIAYKCHKNIIEDTYNDIELNTALKKKRLEDNGIIRRQPPAVVAEDAFEET